MMFKLILREGVRAPWVDQMLDVIYGAGQWTLVDARSADAKHAIGIFIDPKGKVQADDALRHHGRATAVPRHATA